MHFYLPRRHRRPLLFPPGLLALAGLLWLGCVALGPWQERLRLRSIIQLVILPLSPRANTPKDDASFSLPSLTKIRAMGPWRDNILTGNDRSRAQEQARLIIDIRRMMADSAHQGRVSVQLAPASHYQDLIFLLDLMHREKVEKYWLDIVHKPTTFYALTNLRNRQDEHMYSDFLTTPYTLPQTPFWTRFTDMNNWWPLFQIRAESWQPLISPGWRWPAALLMLIAGCCLWRFRF